MSNQELQTALGGREFDLWHWTRMARLEKAKCVRAISDARANADYLPKRSTKQDYFGMTRPQWLARANAIEHLLAQAV